MSDCQYKIFLLCSTILTLMTPFFFLKLVLGFLPTSQPGVVNYIGECGSNYKCDLCEGDCDSDSDCAGDLICLQRDGFEAVPGCSGAGGARDVYAKDICVDKQASLSPSALPSASPSVSISASPSASPIDAPSVSPTASTVPSAPPSVSISASPSASPIDAPSTSPTYQPSLSPSALPSALPSFSISASPSASPSSLPSASPIDAPSTSPTYQLVYSIDGPKTNSGLFEFKESESLSEPSIAVTSWNPLTREYTIEVVLPSTVPCPINLVSGRTFYFLLAGACYRAQLYSDGTVERDGNDTVCSSATFNSQGIFSLFGSLNQSSNQAVFDVGTLGYSGLLSFKESTSVSELSAKLNAFNSAQQVFNVELTLPSESCRATSAAE